MGSVLGAAKKRQTARSPADARELADIELLDWRGREVRLGDAWSENPAVLVFLRHYG
jgi:hypothetical protein